MKIFVSYAHADDDLRRDLRAHLTALDYVDVWDDREIGAGTQWNDEIEAEVDSADIILLLISKDFIGSTYVKEVEIKKALERHRARTARVIPVLLRHCLWKKLEIRELQAFPADEKWVTSSVWDSRDAAFLSVVNGIERVAQELFEDRRRQLEELKTAEETYRKKVAEMLSDDDRISFIERDTLEELRSELELSKQQAEAIEAGELQPIEEKRKNLAKYEKTLEQALERKGLPFDSKLEKDLEKRRGHLGLTAEDAAGAQKRVIGRWKAQQKAEQETEREAKDDAALKAKEESERKAKEKAETEAEAEAEAEREAKEEAAREAKAKAEAERKAREKAEREAREKAESEAREKAEREAKEKAEREAKEKAEREAKAEAEREAKAEAAREAKAEAARKEAQVAQQTVETPTEAEAQLARSRFCRKCGAQLIVGTKFCKKCGTPS